MEENKYNFYTPTEKKLLIEYKYDWIDVIIPPLYQVKKNGKYGIVNEDGKILIPIEHRMLTYSGESGGYRFTSGTQKFLINNKQKVYIQLK